MSLAQFGGELIASNSAVSSRKMGRRSRTSQQEPVVPPPLANGTLMDAAWLCGNEWFKGVIGKEDEHDKVGHRWFVKFNDGDSAWLEDKYVRRHEKASSSSNQVASPPVVSRTKKNAAAKSKAVGDAGNAPAENKAKKAAPVEKAAETEEEKEVVEEKLQEECQVLRRRPGRLSEIMV